MQPITPLYPVSTSSTGQEDQSDQMEEGKAIPQSHVKEVGSEGGRRSFGAKLKAHLRKWWWLHLIFFIASTLIIVLCLVYVGFPRISQDGVNDSTLEIQSLTLSNPTPDSFHLEQDALLTNHNRYHPRLDAFNASLSVGGSEDKPYAYVELPAVHATDTTTTHVNQDVQIVNMDAFVDYTTQLLIKDSVDLVIKGRTKLHEMRLPTTTVDYHKTAHLKGLNGLAGFNVTSFSIKLIPEPDGANMVGTVYIPNPTVMTITMGNVTFNNYVDEDFIGTSSLSDLVLEPGNNTIPMRSTVNQTLVIEKVTETYKDGMLPVDIVGNSSVYNGQHLEYFEKALQSNRQHVVLNVGAALAAVGGAGPSL
ncbi:MAG: hypothetical protein LQ338_001853 [Usnochroma carphineum]|nr:MAG: hypothetical protein LQ338_001853 [Usnochroma carphineum]